MSPIPQPPNGAWVRRQTAMHRCSLPVLRWDEFATTPGDRWRCACGQLREVEGGDNVSRPGKWLRWAAVRRWRLWGSDPIPASRVVHPPPPVGPSGVSPGPDGSR